jgi:citrate synthase
MQHPIYMSEIASIILSDKKYDLPVITGTENEKALDISKLRDQTGYITLDSGYKNTGATKSAITFLDGEKGILKYRGYPIEQLAEKSSFIEVAYLLIYGELPTQPQLDEFEALLQEHAEIPEELKSILSAFPAEGHPMGKLCSIMGSLSAFYPESLKLGASKAEKNLTLIKLVAKIPAIVAWIQRHTLGLPYIAPEKNIDYVSNFMKMTFGEDADPIVIDAMNKLLILHADHEQNCSTSTVRIVGSSDCNLYASIAAGSAALWGPLHGGANQAVIEMLEKIKNDGGDTAKWVAKAKDKTDSFRLMGFGHRVYKNFDPRAKIIKKACDDILAKLGVNDPVLSIAKQLEEAALNDPYFADRKLYPNVDFYSGIIYRALGFPTEMFTVLFALGRLPGWVAQWNEMRENKEPIGRPRQVYVGNTQRDFVDIEERQAVPVHQ